MSPSVRQFHKNTITKLKIVNKGFGDVYSAHRYDSNPIAPLPVPVTVPVS